MHRFAVLLLASLLTSHALAQDAGVGEPVPPPPGQPQTVLGDPVAEPAEPAPQLDMRLPPQQPAPQGRAPTAQAAPPPTRRLDEDVRADSEMKELYVTALAVGAGASIYGLALSGTDDTLPWLTIPFLGAGAGALAVYLIDDSSPFPRGVPSAISMSTAVGLGEGVLLLGLLADDLERCDGDGCDPDWPAVASVLFASTLIGTTVGALVGYTLRPTIGENRLVASAAGWGSFLGSMTGLGIDPDHGKLALPLAFSTSILLLGVSIVTSAMTDVSLETVALMNGMVVIGSLVGLMVAGIVYLANDRDEASTPDGTVPTSLAIGGAAGLGLGIFLAALGDEEEDNKPGDIAVGVAPVQGGATLSAGVVF